MIDFCGKTINGRIEAESDKVVAERNEKRTRI
jgi:hypothetical protein